MANFDRSLAWRKRWEVLERQLGDELILVGDREAGDNVYVISQPSGWLIWKLLAQARTLNGLVGQLGVARGRASTEQDEAEVLSLLTAMGKAELIAPVSAQDGALDLPAADPTPGMDSAPFLEQVDLNNLRPKELFLQGISSGFHAGSHSHPGSGC